MPAIEFLDTTSLVKLKEHLQGWVTKTEIYNDDRVQLDGFIENGNPAAAVVFNLRPTDPNLREEFKQRYQLAGDTRRSAVKHFLTLFAQNPDPDLIFDYVWSAGGAHRQRLKLKGLEEPQYWYCLRYMR